MRTLGNILWHFPFFGFISASLTYLVGLLLTVTVIAAPIGLGQMEFGKFLFAPFGHAMISKSSVNVEQNPAWETYSTIIMVLYFPFGLLFATLAVIQVGFLFLSIIGIPVALVVAKSLSTYLNPVGKICVSSAVRDEIDRRKGQAEVTKYLGAGDRGTVTNVLQPVAQPLPPTSATVSPAPADKVERIESAADNSIICRGCGHASSAGNRFCAKCGASIMDVGSPSAMPPPQPKESAHTSAGRASSAMFSAVVVIGLLIAALVIVIYTKPPSFAITPNLEQPTSTEAIKEAILFAFREDESEARSAPKVSLSDGKFSIELSAGDGQSVYYKAPATAVESEIWDLVFVEAYFLAGGDEPVLARFQQKNQALASIVMKKYSPLCAPSQQDIEHIARCIADHLTRKNNVRFANVRYGEGSRCVMWNGKVEVSDAERGCMPYQSSTQAPAEQCEDCATIQSVQKTSGNASSVNSEEVGIEHAPYEITVRFDDGRVASFNRSTLSNPEAGWRIRVVDGVVTQ